MSEIDNTVVLQPVGDLIVVPLKGPVSEALLNELSAKLLKFLHEKGARGVVLDMTGIEVMDRQDFNDLRKVSESASLMGAPLILAGIRPGVAIGLTLCWVSRIIGFTQPELSIWLWIHLHD